jgi:glutamate synthase domain-containing protein 2
MLDKLNRYYPVRYTAMLLSAFVALLSLLAWVVGGVGFGVLLVSGGLFAVGVYDMRQSTRSVLRNYPIVGHLRYMLEFVRPEIRQYFLESDTEAAPFSRAQRSLVYARAKGDADQRPFGTQLDVQATGYEWIHHAMVPTHLDSHDFRTRVGGPACTKPYDLSLFNVSAMSFGSLSANAIQALNRGAALGGFAHDTGEGSISVHHEQHGGDLIWEIGSGYFGCRDSEGNFDPERFQANATREQVKMIEIKLSQGAKPGHGGVLLGAKVTPEIALARGVPVGEDCISPSSHKAFSTPKELLAFITQLRDLSGGKPVGIKLCVGHAWEWFAIAKAMLDTGVTPDFIVVDGSEGGTGAAPLEFSDHMGMPLQDGLRLVHNTLVGTGLRERIRIGASGKVVSAFDIARALALGADWCNSARGFMFAVGCIQAQTCHTGHCPTGVTTQDPVRQQALVVPDKAQRVFNFHLNTLKSLKEMTEAAGLTHPNDISPDHMLRRVSHNTIAPLSELLPAVATNALLANAPDDSASDWPPVFQRFWGRASSETFTLQP